MEHYYSYKDVKHDVILGKAKERGGLFCKQHVNTLFSKQSGNMEALPQLSQTIAICKSSICTSNRAEGTMVTLHPLHGEYGQRVEKDHSDSQPLLKKSGSFHTRLNQNALDLESRKKKRWFISPTPNKKSHTPTLSESFVNLIMVDGKKGKAEKIFSQTLKKLAEHLQNGGFHHVEGKPQKKKKITDLNRKENATLLVLSDKIEKRNVYGVLQKAIDNVKPTLQVRKVRIARSIYQVPFIMNKKRQEKGGIRWIIEGAKKRSTSSHFAKQNVRATFSECLALSVLEAFVGQGQAREKRDQLHRTAEANRAYLRYRWW